MQVDGYVRVSTEEQSLLGVSLAAQEEKIRAYCGLHALTLSELTVDAGVSAKSLDRPGLARVMGRLQSGTVDGLVVVKLDRLTRSVRDWGDLIERFFSEKGGRAIMSVSEHIDTRTAVGRMMLNMIMTIAQWERETIAERTQGAMDFKRSLGEWLGGSVPYGFDLGADGKTLVANEWEQEMIAWMKAKRAEGMTYSGIAERLNGRVVTSRHGGLWTHRTVSKVLNRKQSAKVA